MSTTDRYNGWANYETWNVALWLGNDEGLYRAYRRLIPFTDDSLEAFVREVLPNGTPDFHDMGKARAYAKVDWQEIADSLNEE